MTNQTINRTDLIEQFQQVLQPAATLRVMYLTGDAKTGKTHMLTHVLPSLVTQMPHASYATIDLRHPIPGAITVLNTAAYLMGDEATFATYHEAYQEWLMHPPVAPHAVHSVFSFISGGSHQTGQQSQMVRHLTRRFVDDVRNQANRLLVFLFDTLEGADQHTQNWLINTLIANLTDLPHVRVVVAGRTLPERCVAPSEHTCSYVLTPIHDPEPYVAYCQQSDIPLTEDLIQDSIVRLHYNPGLFAEFAWHATHQSGSVDIQSLSMVSDSAAKAALIAERIIQALPETTALIARRCVLLHWFDQQTIAALLPDTAHAEAATLYQQLAMLPCMESPASVLAYNDLTRRGLLEHYVVTQPDMLQAAAAMAAPVYARRAEIKLTIEALFCYLVAGDTEAAASLFDRQLPIFIARDQWQSIIAMQRHIDEAEALPFVQPMRRTSNYWLARGITAQIDGDLSEAIIAYNKAVESDPGNTNAYVSRGSAHLVAALADFDTVHELDPDAIFTTYQELAGEDTAPSGVFQHRDAGTEQPEPFVATDELTTDEQAPHDQDDDDAVLGIFNRKVWREQVMEQLSTFGRKPWQDVQLIGSDSVITYLVMCTLSPLLEQFEREPVAALQALLEITTSTGINYIVHHARRMRYQPARLFERDLYGTSDFRTVAEEVILQLDVVEVLHTLLTCEQMTWLRETLSKECQEYGNDAFARLRQKLHETHRSPLYDRLQALRQRQGNYVSEDLETLQEGLDDATPRVRVVAARRMAELVGIPSGQLASRLLQVALHDRDARVRHAAAHTLGKLGERIVSEPMHDELALKLTDDDKFVRSSAAHVIEEVGELVANPTIIHRLVQILLHDNDMYARESAACALGQLGVSAAIPEVMNALMKVSREDESITVHDATVSALMSLKKSRKKASIP